MGEIARIAWRDLRLRNYSRRTERAYVRSARARAFVAFHRKSPIELGEKDIRAFLTWLVTEKRISPNGMRKFVGGIRRTRSP